MKYFIYGSLGLAAVFIGCSQQAAPKARYDSPESILADYDRAMSFTQSSATVNLSLVHYYTCKAFKARSIEPCRDVDSKLEIIPVTLPCRGLYVKGLMSVELIAGSGAIDRCIDDVNVWAEILHNTAEDDGPDHIDGVPDEEVCRGSIPYWVKGDLNGYCAFLKKSSTDLFVSMEHCRKEYAYLSGDTADCPDFDGNNGWQEYCRMSANLQKAIREKKPHLMESTKYAPLLLPDAGCDGLAEKVMAAYEAVKKH